MIKLTTDMFSPFLSNVTVLMNSVEVLSRKTRALTSAYENTSKVQGQSLSQEFPLQSTQLVLTISTYKKVPAAYVKYRATYKSL